LNPHGHKLIIFGAGGLGLAVAETLRERGLDFLLVSPDGERVQAAQGKGFTSAQVDFTDDEALKAIGIGSSARTIFCLFEEMSNNFFLTLSARALAPELTIISICSSAASSSKLIAAGANKTIDPYVLTGRWIHNLIRRPLVVETLYGILLGNADLEVSEIAVTSGSKLAGLRLGQLDLHSYEVMLLGAVQEGQDSELLLRTNHADYELKPGDVLVLIGAWRDIERLREDTASGTGAESAPIAPQTRN
jgi:voltage-gated potassium channel